MAKFGNSVGGTRMTLAQKAKRHAFSWEQFFAVEKRKITEAVENHVIGRFEYKSDNFWQMFKEYVGTPLTKHHQLSLDPEGLVGDSQYEHGMDMFLEWLSEEGLGMELITDYDGNLDIVVDMFVFIED